MLFDTDRGALEVVTPLEPQIATNRTNDAKCDPDGRLGSARWSSTARPAKGALYRFDEGGLAEIISGTSCSNGIAWSPDVSTMYYIDSLAGGIDYVDDRERGGIGRGG